MGMSMYQYIKVRLPTNGLKQKELNRNQYLRFLPEYKIGILNNLTKGPITSAIYGNIEWYGPIHNMNMRWYDWYEFMK